MDDSQYEVPRELREILLEFTVSVLVERPGDIIGFASDYFKKLKDTKEKLEHDFKSPSLASDSEGSCSDEIKDDNFSSLFPATRRKSVFAETYDPEREADVTKILYPKDIEERRKLHETVEKLFLFKSLDKNQMEEMIDAMFSREVVPGETIITQGDYGDNFYVIESGIYDIFVKNDKSAEPKWIGKYENTGCFGELALMYNVPRAATIKSVTEGRLWAMERNTFRRILLLSAFKKRKMYEDLLEKVPMLSALEKYERMTLADVLVPKKFDSGQLIIKQGDPADGMYFIEEGSIRITILNEEGKETEISTLGIGSYFGELALVTHKPRAASVYAVDSVKLAFLDVHAFERLLGPCMDIMKRNIKDYELQLKSILKSDIELGELRTY